MLKYFVALVLMTSCSAQPRDEQDSNSKQIIGSDLRQEVLSSAFPSSSLMYISIANQDVCTGSIIGKKYVLTAAHCFEGANKPATILGFQNHVDDIKRLGARLPVRNITAKVLNLAVIKKGNFKSETDIKEDWAVLEVQNPDFDGSLDAMPLVQTPAVASVLLPGYSVDRFDRLGSASIDFNCHAKVTTDVLINHDCDTSFGASGAPIWTVDLAAQKIAQIGLHTGGLNDHNAGVPSASFEQAVTSLGIKIAAQLSDVPTKNLFQPSEFPNKTWGERGSVVGISAVNGPEFRTGQNGAVMADKWLLVWGGYVNSVTLNTGSLYNYETDSWKDISTVNAPTARFGHSVAVVNDKFIVWGGGSGGCQFDGGVYDPATDKWTTMSRDHQPNCRTRHTAVGIDGKMIVWGGLGQGDMSEGGIYDLKTNKWSKMDDGGPVKLAGASAVAIGHKMVIFGGSNQTFSRNTDGGAIYDLDKDAWSYLPLLGAPQQRAGHAAAAIGHKMVIWGGYDEHKSVGDGGVFDLDTMSWSTLSLSNLPSPRGTTVSGAFGDKMVVWGGVGDKQSFKEGWIFDIGADTTPPVHN